jgi:hypothetical protein
MWVVEVSRTGRCFHINTLAASLKTNLANVLRAKDYAQINDFIPVGLFENVEDAQALANELQTHLEGPEEN